MIYKKIKAVLNALVKSEENYIVIYPNNDNGSDIIFSEFKKKRQQ